MSNNKQSSSVEWFKKELEDYGTSERLKIDWKTFDELFEQAKAMQQEQAKQYAEFCVQCDRQNLPLLEFNSWIAHNETFNNNEQQ